MNNQFNDLAGGTRRRLNILKNEAAKMNSAKIKHYQTGELVDRYVNAGAYTWKNVRYRSLNRSYSSGRSKHNRSYVCMELKTLEGLRDIGHSDDIVSMRNRGWYCDIFQDETYRGHVWQLPARDGLPVYIAGYIEIDAEYVVLSASNGRIDMTDDKDQAARWADELARVNAERQAEYSAADDAVQLAANDIEQYRDECRAIIKDLKAQKAVGPLAGAICGRLLSEFNAARENMKKAFDEFNKARDHLAWLDAYNLKYQ